MKSSVQSARGGRSACFNPARSRGYNLIELMVGMVIGLVVTASAIAFVIAASRTARDLNDSSVQVENGRYAVKLLRDELAHAGFFGVWSDPEKPGSTLPDPCKTSMSDAVADDIDNAWAFYIQGYAGAEDSPLSPCLSNSEYVANTDLLVVRRVETLDSADLPSIDELHPYAGHAFLQSMPTEGVLDVVADDADTEDTNAMRFNLKKRDGTTPADVRRLVSRIFFISPYSTTVGDGIPTLKQLGLGAVGASLELTPLVEGVEDMQLEFGIDNGGVTAGAPDSFVTSITDVEDWGKIVAVRVHLLVRNLDASPGYQNNKTYVLGRDDNGADYAVTPGDGIKRRVYSFTVRLVNPSIRNKFES